MADMGKTETSATGVNVVANYVQQELALTSKLLGTIMDFSSYANVPGAKSVKIPRSGSFTAQNKVENTGTTTQALTYATDEIVFDKYKHIPVLLEDDAAQESVLSLEQDIVKKMASGLVAAIEADIYSVIKKAANEYRLTGAGNALVTKADILAGILALDLAKCPDSDRFLLVSPKQKGAMLAIADFVKANEVGNNSAIQNGQFGEIFGLKVIVSAAVGENEVCIYHRSHASFALRQDVKYESQRASLTFLGTEHSMSARYGVKQLDSGVRGWFADESTVA